MTSTQLRGHGLRAEGAAFTAAGLRRYPGRGGGPGHAKCACGARSPELPSQGARQRWHRDHKLAILGVTT